MSRNLDLMADEQFTRTADDDRTERGNETYHRPEVYHLGSIEKVQGIYGGPYWDGPIQFGWYDF
jgi:hypothetical protein